MRVENGSPDISGARVLHNHLLEFDRHPPDGRHIVGNGIAEASAVESPCYYCQALYIETLLASRRMLP